MTREDIELLSAEYIKDYVPMYQKVARNAYEDGILDALRWIKEKLSEL